jgi:peptidoglycan/xylan/chitin deacetylase (PgdA/CDA1 family)
MLCAGRLRTRTACITFDDGYLDNFTTALPILRRHAVPASFFIATGYLNGGRMWNDTVAEAVRQTSKRELELRSLGLVKLPTSTAPEKTETACRIIDAIKHRKPTEREAAAAVIAEKCGISDLPNDLMMSEDHVRQLYDSGMEIGAHTVTHPILALCDDETARREIADSKRHLEAIVGDRIKLFAYPNGKRGIDYSERHVAMVRDLGFYGAVSTDPGASRTGDEKLELRRFTPWDRGRTRFALRLARNLV